MTLQIDTRDSIIINGKDTGLKLTQRREGTVIYTPVKIAERQNYKEHKMPYNRYSAYHDAPHQVGKTYDPMITAGRLQLESDVLKLISRL